MINNSSKIDFLCTTDFISIDEQAELQSIALDYYKKGILQSNPRGPHRFRAKIWGTKYCTDFIQQIGSMIVDSFELQKCPVDPQLGWIVSLIESGGQIHPHRDKYPYHDLHNAKHLRCNIMVSKENSSGNPVIDDQIIDIPERAIWGFFPSEALHATQVIDMNEPRIVFQFGFMVPNSYRLPS